MSTNNKYRISVPQNHLQQIDRTSPANVGILINAVNNTVFHKTPDPASADGMVTDVKDGPNVGGQIHHIETGNPSFTHSIKLIFIYFLKKFGPFKHYPLFIISSHIC
jgi:hypothetical protein